MRNFLTRTVKAVNSSTIVSTVHPFVASTEFGFGKFGGFLYISIPPFYVKLLAVCMISNYVALQFFSRKLNKSRSEAYGIYEGSAFIIRDDIRWGA